MRKPVWSIPLTIVVFAMPFSANQNSASNAFAESANEPTLEEALDRFELVEHAEAVQDMLPNWTNPTKIVAVVDSPEREEWLQKTMPSGVKVVGVSNDADAHKEVADANAVVQSRCLPEYFKGAKQLLWIRAGGAGSDQCLVIEGVSSGEIVVTNSQKVKNTALAEMAIGHMFAMARSVDVTVNNQRLHRLRSENDRPGKRLSGSTLLIVGLGGSGREIARLAHELGMTVIATRASSRDGPEFVSYVGLPDELPELIGRADVVIVCAPLTPSTDGLFDANMFQLMKEDSILINWTRTEIVNMDALEKALREKSIGSAAINWATYAELPKDDSLWTTPNLLLTTWGGSGQPIADSTEDDRVRELRWLVLRENMRRFANGDRLYSVFDTQRGY